jgi:hypothetical protein
MPKDKKKGGYGKSGMTHNSDYSQRKHGSGEHSGSGPKDASGGVKPGINSVESGKGRPMRNLP